MHDFARKNGAAQFQLHTVYLPDKAIRHQVASAINIIVQIARMSDGKRRVIKISEVTGMEGDVITMQDIFVFDRSGLREDGAVLGRFRSTGIRPKASDQLAASGINLPPELFEHQQVIE